jgi:hypothetical protein
LPSVRRVQLTPNSQDEREQAVKDATQARNSARDG